MQPPPPTPPTRRRCPHRGCNASRRCPGEAGRRGGCRLARHAPAGLGCPAVGSCCCLLTSTSAPGQHTLAPCPRVAVPHHHYNHPPYPAFCQSSASWHLPVGGVCQEVDAAAGTELLVDLAAAGGDARAAGAGARGAHAAAHAAVLRAGFDQGGAGGRLRGCGRCCRRRSSLRRGVPSTSGLHQAAACTRLAGRWHWMTLKPLRVYI